MDGIDHAIAALAVTQGGHVTRAQLRTLGLGRGAIDDRIDRGRLIAMFHGVYAVGHRPTNSPDAAHGALLACGPRCGLSHGSAASLYGVYDRWRRPFEVSSGLDRRPRGVRVHHRPALLRRDYISRDGLRVTTQALTLLDITPRLDEKRLVRAVNTMRMEHRLQLDDVRALIDRFPRHPGARSLAAVVGGAPDEHGRSAWELDWPPYAARFDLPDHETNVFVCGYRVDIRFVPDLLIVELDGWDTHGTKAAFESDREQDLTILAELGVPTVRITHARFHRRPAREAARLHRTLAARRLQLGLDAA